MSSNQIYYYSLQIFSKNMIFLLTAILILQEHVGRARARSLDEDLGMLRAASIVKEAEQNFEFGNFASDEDSPTWGHPKDEQNLFFGKSEEEQNL